MFDEIIVKIVPNEETVLVGRPALPEPRFMDDSEIKNFCGGCAFISTKNPEVTGCSELTARERQELFVARGKCAFRTKK
ncbi:MAG: hypothetical protein NTY75_03500 [Candidatus Shapirobacteria bacterium]|nr:hypothetical protein [Candidatus Shapirobacteria bacterium]